jgi:hypothetical protein
MELASGQTNVFVHELQQGLMFAGNSYQYLVLIQNPVTILFWLGKCQTIYYPDISFSKDRCCYEAAHEKRTKTPTTFLSR